MIAGNGAYINKEIRQQDSRDFRYSVSNRDHINTKSIREAQKEKVSSLRNTQLMTAPDPLSHQLTHSPYRDMVLEDTASD